MKKIILFLAVIVNYPLSSQSQEDYFVNKVSFVGNEVLRKSDLFNQLELKPSSLSLFSKPTFDRRLLKLDAISIAVMRPSRNIASFNLICAPEHDFIKQLTPNNVVLYQGALASPSFAAPDNEKAIIAIGGKSKHYKFDEKVVLMQLQYI